MTEPRTQWKAVAVLLAAGLFSAAQFGKFTLTLTQLTAHYGATAGLLVSVVGIVGIVFGAVAGGHVARFGLRRAMIWALIVGGCVSLAQSVLPTTAVMFALRGVEGVSHLAIVIAAPTLMAGLANDRDRPVVMGIWASFFGVALAILAVITPALLAMGDLFAVLVFHGGGMLAMAWTVARNVPQEQPQTVEVKRFISEHRAIYSNPKSVIAGGGFVFYTILYIALIAVLPLELGFGATQTAILPLISLIGTFGAGYLARRFAPPAITLFGFGAMLVIILWCAWAPGLIAVTAIFLAAGFIPGGAFATIPFFNDSLADRARATGAIAQLGNVGTTLGTPIFVLTLSLGGLNAVLLVAAFFAASGIAATWILWAKCAAPQ
ncbi:MAG: MFS transporter [Pseudomonadota bacterium]